MNPPEAAKLLELPADATPDQIEARFNELRARLEDKIAKAPTPGLKAKYRETLEQITAAFETLALAADGSALPVLRKEAGGQGADDGGRKSDGGAAPPPRGPSAQTQVPRPSSARKSGGREFALVAVIAIAVLGAGGWFILKTRAENAEKARITAVNQAEADRQAEVARQEAEAEKARLAEAARLAAEQKERQAAAAAAEQTRLDALATQIRIQLAEAGVAWEVAEREGREAERTLSDLKSEVRSLRDASPGTVTELNARLDAQQAYAGDLGDLLLRHPARIARARTEELLNSREIDQAAQEANNLMAALAALPAEIEARKARAAASLHGAVRVKFDGPIGHWWIEDAFGRRREGTTEQSLSRIARGTATLGHARPGFPEMRVTFTVRAGEEVSVTAHQPGGTLQLTANVPGAEVWQNDRKIGAVPLTRTDQAPGSYRFEIRAEGHVPARLNGELASAGTLALAAELRKRIPTEAEIIADFTTLARGVWVAKGGDQDTYFIGRLVLRIMPGDSHFNIRARSLGIDGPMGGHLKVPDRATGLITCAHSEWRQRPTSTSTVSFEDDHVVLRDWSGWKRVVFTRGTDKDW